MIQGKNPVSSQPLVSYVIMTVHSPHRMRVTGFNQNNAAHHIC